MTDLITLIGIFPRDLLFGGPHETSGKLFMITNMIGHPWPKM